MEFPLKTAIVENEIDELKALKELLDQRKDIFDVKEALSEYSAAIEILKLRPFDLCILDVSLDEGQDCYNLIEEVGQETMGILALTTQFPTLPKKALNFRGCLPFEKPYRKENLDVFIDLLFKEVREIQNLKVYDIPTAGGKTMPLQQDKICFIAGKGKHTQYFVVDNFRSDYKIIQSTDTFEDALDRLSKDFFIQVHRSVIFNIGYYKSRSSGRVFGLKTTDIINTGIPSKTKIRCGKQYLPALLKKLKIDA